ncbi:response regulator transcription factor [bacterium]|nr:response regulator transcription factor [bacterium]
MRLMLVDDHELVREGLRLLLESESGWSVIAECRDSTECREALRQERPDLLLLDLNLPDCSGLELVWELRQQQADLPILVVSSSEELQMVSAAMRAGASGYVVKSARRAELVSAVRVVGEGGCYLHPRVASAIFGHLQSGDTPPLSGAELSERETAVVQYVCQGLSNPDIAALLHVSLSTIKNDLSLIFRKWVVRDRTQLAAEATRRGWNVQPLEAP